VKQPTRTSSAGVRTSAPHSPHGSGPCAPLPCAAAGATAAAAQPSAAAAAAAPAAAPNGAAAPAAGPVVGVAAGPWRAPRRVPGRASRSARAARRWRCLFISASCCSRQGVSRGCGSVQGKEVGKA
jgi:hypothetical protein